jgi:hypothetical protein
LGLGKKGFPFFGWIHFVGHRYFHTFKPVCKRRFFLIFCMNFFPSMYFVELCWPIFSLAPSVLFSCTLLPLGTNYYFVGTKCHIFVILIWKVVYILEFNWNETFTLCLQPL